MTLIAENFNAVSQIIQSSANFECKLHAYSRVSMIKLLIGYVFVLFRRRNEVRLKQNF